LPKSEYRGKKDQTFFKKRPIPINLGEGNSGFLEESLKQSVVFADTLTEGDVYVD